MAGTAVITARPCRHVNVIQHINTTTGVKISTIKSTRKVESSLNAADGDALLIGGLMQDKSTRVNSGLSFLPPCMAGYTASTGKAEIVLLLQVQKI